MSPERAADPTTPARTHVYATDANGSVTGLEQSDGVVLDNDRYSYNPYGQLDQAEPGLSADAAENPFRFQGFYFDAQVNTYDMGARNYRPAEGRFLQPDVYEGASADLALQADPLTQNRYAFAAGNPTSRVESDGHDAHGIEEHMEKEGYSPKDTGQRQAAADYGRSESHAAKRSRRNVRVQEQRVAQIDRAARARGSTVPVVGSSIPGRAHRRCFGPVRRSRSTSR